MISKKASPVRSNLNPRQEVKLRLEREEVSQEYTPEQEESNVIFWGTKMKKGTGILEKIRTYIWFYPDFIAQFIHKLRPFSYLIIYAVISLLIWQTVVYAQNQPNSVLNIEPKQVLYEGTVGNVNIINPLYLTHNQTERDLQQLVFSKLIRVGTSGIPENELAETWSTSSDGKTYTFFLRKDVRWHDGEKFTADDVIFTFETVQKLKDENSLAEKFEKIKVSKIDDFTVTFELPEENATFIESVPIGIVPKHILENERVADMRVTLFNQYPIGTGPFMVDQFSEKEIVLKRNENYFKDTPKLKEIRYIFYPSTKEAILAMKEFKLHSINSVERSTRDELSEYNIYKPQEFTIYLRNKVIFFNLKGDSLVSSTSIRKVLSLATNKKKVIEATQSDGEISKGPISDQSWAYDDEIERYNYNQDKAKKLLEDNGWVFSNGIQVGAVREKNGKKLQLTLSFLDTEINNHIAEELKLQWAEIGIDLILDTQKYEKIVSETIPRREFDMLLFEVENTPDPDQYNLWHSLQIDYPGLNVSGYSYDRVDIILERARKSTDLDERKEDYSLFQKYFMEDMPALYLFHPSYTFIMHKNVKGIKLENVSLPQERYNNVEDWYIKK